MARPEVNTYSPAFETYITKVKETDIYDAFVNQQSLVDSFFESLPEDKHAYAYAPGKWTLKEMLQHIIDSERIFNYRSLCFARKEPQSLPGFDENFYADNSNANTREWKSLCEELKTVRQATRHLFDSFNETMLIQPGVANNKPATALSLGFATVGHLYHHVYVIETKYLGTGESC